MSCNSLAPHLADTLSEVSESGSGTSGWNSNWDSREELQEFIAKLGVKDVADLYQDRFKVDRKQLEQMLTGEPKKFVFFLIFFITTLVFKLILPLFVNMFFNFSSVTFFSCR